MRGRLLFTLLIAGFIVALPCTAALAQIVPNAAMHVSGPQVTKPTDTVGYPLLPGIVFWNELWPQFGGIQGQADYDDNVDGVYSYCDYINLNTVLYHVAWVGPTYHLRRVEVPDTTMVAEPYGVITDDDPSGQTWHEVNPVYCQDWLIEDWMDNGDLFLSVCDTVIIDGQRWHVEDMTLDLILEKRVPSTTRVGTAVLVALLALTGVVLFFRSRRRTADLVS